MSDRLITTLEIIFGAIIASLPGVLAAISGARRAKKQDVIEERTNLLQLMQAPGAFKTAAGDAADKVAQAYDKLVEDLQERIKRMEERQRVYEEKMRTYEERINSLECQDVANKAEIRKLQAGVRVLNQQVRDYGGSPAFTINGDDK